MIYREFRNTGIKLSSLGFGGMRFKRNADDKLDFDAGEKLLDFVYSQGINYFDTAYVYLDGDSERLYGKVLTKYPRDSYYIADKFPIFIIDENNKDQVPAIFQESLDRLQADYIDFYLCHSVNEATIDPYIDYNVITYLDDMKKQGKIRFLGFSLHGGPDCLKKALDYYPNWDFVQLQINYLDWDNHGAKELYDICTAHNLPIMVMEPVRGGRLADLSPEANAVLKNARPDMSIASWAFRWMQGLDNVQVVLSGMNTNEQVIENCALFDNNNPLSTTEKNALDQALELFLKKFSVPCTSCRYCTEVCPMKLQIPDMLGIYNEILLTDDQMPYLKSIEQPDNLQPRNCINCGACKKRCPQFIEIPEMLQDMDKRVQDFLASGTHI